KNVFAMMAHTRIVYLNIQDRSVPIDERFERDAPGWEAMDSLGDAWASRLAWGLLYTVFYVAFAPSLWWFILLPIQWLMSPVHGA
ncbi:hypothetical protein ACEV85_23655, partial [Vibrio parahaemolyticus]